MKKLILKSALAGLLIGLAGWAFLVCQTIDIGAWTKPVGACVFSIGLVAVILLEANLYTGKVGYIDDKTKLWQALVMLAINLIAAYLVGLVYRGCIGTATAMASRVSKTWYRMLIDSIGCGICIYIAVECYKKSKSLLPVVLGVVVFILAGFEHCIADVFYLGASDFSIQGLLYILIAVAGNSIGSLACRWLQICAFKNKEK